MTAQEYDCASPQTWLQRVDPLAKICASLPAMVALVFARSWQFPSFIIIITIVIIGFGVRLGVRNWLLLVVALPLLICIFAVVFAVWVDPQLTATSPQVYSAHGLKLTKAGLGVGLATALRLAALVLLAFMIGVSCTPRQLVLALITYLRLPYRAGYAILIGVRFVPQTRLELRRLRQARRVRAVGGAPWRRWATYLIPLGAGALRRAERVALAMDARGFGAYDHRTERDALQMTVTDVLFVVTAWVLTASGLIWI